MDLHIKYRPTDLDSIVGQPQAVKQLRGFLNENKVPHVLGFYGPPGVGKTTLARIMANEVGATDMNITEINLAVKNGIDDVRSLQERCALRPLGGKNAAFILDEAHSLTKQAYQGLLKLFEDTPKHVYFFLCTSQPEKIDKAIKTRVTGINLHAVSESVLVKLIIDIADLEAGIILEAEHAEPIARAANGSPRQALVYLGQALACGFDPVAMASLFATTDEKVNYFPICEAIMFPKQGDWGRVYGLIMSIPEDEVESARHMILSYAKSCMKQQKNAERGARVIQAMKSPFFDSKLAGFLSNYYLVWSKNV
jgi:DNA polymerase III gamma/tau subunit